MRIQHKLALAFFAVSLVSLLGLSSIIINRIHDSGEKNAIVRVQSIASAQEARIGLMLKRYLDRTRTVASLSRLRALTAEVSTSTEPSPVITAELHGILIDVLGVSPEMGSLAVYNSQGDLIAREGVQPAREEETIEFPSADTTVRFVSSKSNPKPFESLIAVTAVMSDGKRTVGFVRAFFETAPLKSVVTDYELLGTTGETVIAFLQEDKIHFVFPVRHMSEFPFKEGVADLGSHLPIEAAFSGEGTSRVVRDIDYRNHEVVAAINNFKDYNLAIAVKIDEEEIQQSEHYLYVSTMLWVALAGLGSIVLSVLFARYFARRLTEIRDAARSIEAGKFDLRAPVHSNDELAELATALNRMAEKLIDANTSLELRVRERTEELEAANKKLAFEAQVRKQQKEELERSNREMEQFAYAASHDLKEPLRMVGSFAELLLTQYKNNLDAAGQEYLDYLVSGARRMQALIDALLRYSRISREPPELEVIDCEVILKEVCDGLGILIAESDATITHDKMPILRANRIQLTQLFQNILSNAIKFRRPEISPQIHIGVSEANGFWRFTVKDNGIGFDQRFADRIFSMFQRLHPHGSYDGTGIGLAICKKIIDLHGGSISAQSQQGMGTTIFFTLPSMSMPRVESEEVLQASA